MDLKRWKLTKNHNGILREHETLKNSKNVLIDEAREIRVIIEQNMVKLYPIHDLTPSVLF